MYVGRHVSIRNGYLGAAKMAKSLGASAFQYFTKNPRSLKLKRYDEHDAEACRRYCLQHNIRSIAHMPYPTNIATKDPKLRQLVEASLRNDLEIAEACGSVGLVVHVGKYVGNDPLQGYKNSIQCLNNVLSDWQGKAQILLENGAGESGQLGWTFEECTTIRTLTQFPELIGFCLDTCHLFVSGIWTGDNWSKVWEQGEQAQYWDFLKAIHLNNSVYASGSRRDQHAAIRTGCIQPSAFRALLSTSWFHQLPIILETPNEEEHLLREELALVKSWYSRNEF